MSATKPAYARSAAFLTAASGNVLSGFVVGILTVAYSFSFGALVFRGPLEAGIGIGIAAALAGAIVSGVVIGLMSSFRTAVGAPEAAVVAIFSTLGASLAARLAERPGVSAEAAVNHVMLAITTISIGVGLLLWLAGAARLSHWLRFVPYPVVGGFIAATGWFLTAGSVRVVTGRTLTLDSLGVLWDPAVLPRFGAAAAFAAAIPLVRRLAPSSYVLPGLMILVTIAAHILFAVAGVDLDRARADGWLLGVAGDFRLWVSTVDLESFRDIDPLALALEAPTAVAVAVVSPIVILLSTSTLEISKRMNADLDREFRAHGLAYLGSAALGGFPGNLTPNRTALNERAGATGPTSAIVASAICLVVLAGGSEVAGLVPTAVLGGTVLYMGVSVLAKWASDAVRRMSRADAVLATAIFLLIVSRDYVEGFGLGLVAACMLFAVSYARVPVVRQQLTRKECSSSVERSRADEQILSEQGRRIVVLKVHGFIFFGTGNRLLEQVQALDWGEAGEGGRQRWLIVEFNRVPGFDSSAVVSFAKLRFHADETGLSLIFCGMRPDIASRIERHPLLRGAGPTVFPTLDDALEACEEALLAERPPMEAEADTLEGWLAEDLGSAEGAAALAPYCRPLTVEPGDWLCRQGDEADSIYLILRGRVSVLLEAPGSRMLRLRSIVEHTIVGEMAFFAGGQRSASVRVDRPSEIYAISREAFGLMRQGDPASTAALADLIIRLLADRLAFTNAEVAALRRD